MKLNSKTSSLNLLNSATKWRTSFECLLTTFLLPLWQRGKCGSRHQYLYNCLSPIDNKDENEK